MEWFTGGSKGRVDSNLDDEAAGRARSKLAADAKARRKKEKQELAKKNAEMRARISANRKTARTDDNLDDEEAGRMRAELAKRSAARRAKEEEMLDKANDKIFASIRSVDVRTDDDIMDEAAGLKRLELAAASEERRQQEKMDLAAKNKHMSDRLAKVRPQVAITSQKGKNEEEKGYYVDPYKFAQPQMGPMGLIRQPGDAPTPSWLGKFDKYDWTAPVIV